MIKNFKQAIIIILIVAGFIAAIVISVKNINDTKAELNTLKKDKDKLILELQNYSRYIDSTNILLTTYKDSITKLSEAKSKIEIKYEIKYKDFTNPAITSDDEVIRYISSKIHSK